MKNPGEIFLSRAHKSHPPKSRGKLWREKFSHSQIMEMPSLSQRSQQLSKEEEDNFPTTNSAQPNYHHRNPKITQKQLKMNSNPIRKPIPNPTQNQPKTKSTQNQPIFIFIIIIIIFSLPCSFRTVKKKRCRDLRDERGFRTIKKKKKRDAET